VAGGGVLEAFADEMMSVIVETAQDYAMPGTMKGGETTTGKRWFSPASHPEEVPEPPATLL
jgi:hypothetical protein